MTVTRDKLQGIYLVLDPSLSEAVLSKKLGECLRAGIDIVQLWDHWPAALSQRERSRRIETVVELCTPYKVPVLLGGCWELVEPSGAQGVHFDEIPAGFEEIKSRIGRDAVIGLTCGNDLGKVRWAAKQGLDYLSFCAMFASRSVKGCDLVRPESVSAARAITDMPLFLSGGIYPDKLDELAHLDFQGVAVISGIMDAESAGDSVLAYRRSLERQKETNT